MRSKLPAKELFLGKVLPKRPSIKLTEFKNSGGNALLFKGHSSALKRDFACKIIPRENLLYGDDGSEIWRDEVHKADVLTSPTVVKFMDIQEWQDQADGVNCIVLISEYVEGFDLREFVLNHSDAISIPFIVDWLTNMLNLLNEMKIKEVVHGDLHAGNILVAQRPSYDLLGPSHMFRVTDFGVSEATSERKLKDDYHQLAVILQQLLEKVKYSQQSQHDKYIFKILRDHFLARHLLETDPTIDGLARNPEELLKRAISLDSEFARLNTEESDRLLTPFDFLSCEQIGETPALLRALYSDMFLGLPEIESQNNVVVTGPRGCGKTTVFRSQGLDHRMSVGEASPEQTQYIGIYYQCLDLYFAFPRYALPTREEAIDIPIHFVTSTLLARLLESLEGWARCYFLDDFVRSEARASESLWNVLGIPAPPSPSGASFKALISALNKQRLKAAERQRFANDQKRTIGKCFGPDVLPKACEVLNRTFAFLRARPFYFFIDDYSSPKIAKALQANLNRLFMQRTSICFFKLSTESPMSFAKYDIDDKIYVESREFVLHNLGLVYLHADLRPRLSFIEDVFRRRLAKSRTNFAARELDELVGTSPAFSQNEIARQIREGKKVLLWGKETLASLCSGDIHYVIGIVRDMVRLCGGSQNLQQTESKPKISADSQNQAIREGAGGFLKNLRGIPQYGEQLVAIVEAFGNVSNSHLKFLNSKNEEGSPAKQASRIEPYQPLSLSPKAQTLYEELLRYSVFIEDFRGKSRRGSVVPRLYLRRFLIPHFNLTFSMRDSVEIEPTDFEMFLINPKNFEKKMRIKSSDDAERFEKHQDEWKNQLSLHLGTPANEPSDQNS